MHLTDYHFNAIAEDLIATLAELGLSKALIDEVIQIVLTVKDDVLNREPADMGTDRWVIIPDLTFNA